MAQYECGTVCGTGTNKCSTVNSTSTAVQIKPTLIKFNWTEPLNTMGNLVAQEFQF